ncbi:MAG: flagellar hook-length control protein FliK, partial [bacterium]
KDKRIKGLRAEAANDSAMQHAADESLKGTKRSRPNNHQGINSLKSPLKETGRKRENQEVQIKPAAGHPKDKNIEGLRAETADNDAAMRNETDESIKGIQRSLPNNHQGINLLKSRLKENRREAENPGIHIKPAAGHLKNKRIEGLHAEAADNDSTMSHEADESIKGSKRSRPNSQQGIHFLKSRLKEHGLKVENLKIKIKPIAGDTAKKKPTHSTEMAKEANKWNISQKQAVAGFLDPLAKISHQSKKAVKIRAPRDEIQSEKGGETNYESENSSKLSSQTEESSWSSEQGNSFLQDKEFFESLKKQNVFNNIQNLSGLLDKGLANENVMAPSHTKEAHILNLIQQISKVTDQLAIATTQKLEVEVEVAKLGKLMVDVTKSNNKINLQIQVENEEAKKWLQNQMSTLHERLTNQGVEIDKLNINLSSDHSGSDAGEKAFTGAGPDNRAQRFLLNKTQNASHDSMPLHLLQRNFGYNTVEVWA